MQGRKTFNAIIARAPSESIRGRKPSSFSFSSSLNAATETKLKRTEAKTKRHIAASNADGSQSPAELLVHPIQILSAVSFRPVLCFQLRSAASTESCDSERQ